MDIIESIRGLELLYKLGIFGFVIALIHIYLGPWLFNYIEDAPVRFVQALDNILGVTFCAACVLAVVSLLRGLVELIFNV